MPAPTVQDIITLISKKLVVNGWGGMHKIIPTAQAIIAGAAMEDIHSSAPGKDVIAVITIHDVTAPPTVQDIITSTAIKTIIAIKINRQRVILIAG